MPLPTREVTSSDVFDSLVEFFFRVGQEQARKESQEVNSEKETIK